MRRLKRNEPGSEGAGTRCVTDDQLLLLVSGWCDPEPAAEILRHLERCPRCRLKLAEHEQVEDDVRRIRRDAAVLQARARPELARRLQPALRGLDARSREASKGQARFSALVKRWQELASRGTAEERQAFFLDLTASDGAWIQACWALVRHPGDAPPSEQQVKALFRDHLASLAYDGLPEWGRDTGDRAALMLRCAQVLASGHGAEGDLEIWEERVRQVDPDASGWGRRLILEMFGILAGERAPGLAKWISDQRRGSVQLPVVMVEVGESGASRGVSATLQLELVEGGDGSSYPAPEVCLVPVDASFSDALEDALEFLRRSGLWDGAGFDLRWTIYTQQPLTLLHGGSLGAAFALGAGELAACLLPSGMRPPLAEKILRVPCRETVCLSGAVWSGDGRLIPLERSGVKEKVEAALADPSIAVLVLPARAAAEVARHYGAHESVQRPGTFFVRFRGSKGLTILCVETLPQALELLVLEENMPEEFNWKRRAAGVNKLVARPWLRKRVGAFLSGSQDGCVLLIQGEPGTGKSGLIARCVSEELERGRSPVVHFITRDFPSWLKPAEIYGSLSAQLRRKHGALLAPPPGAEAAGTDGSALSAAERLVADLKRLASEGVQEVLWIDGLDEAYSEWARTNAEGGALHELVAALDGGCLPPGIRLIATSRPGLRFDHLRRLRDCSARHGHYINLDDPALAREVTGDLRAYFTAEIPGIGPDSLERAINLVRTDRPFLHAVLWARSVKLDPAEQGELTLNQLVDRDLRRIADGWARERENVSTDQARALVLDALGLLACAREPLTTAVVNGLFPPDKAGPIVEIAGHAVRCAVLADTQASETGDRRLRFFHESIAEFILKGDPAGKCQRFIEPARHVLAGIKPEPDLAVFWHRELAAGCLRWRELANPARAYALCFLLSHLRHAHMWKDLEDAISDVELLQAKLNDDPGGIFDFVRLVEKALWGFPRLPMDDAGRPLLNAMLEVLRSHEDSISRPAACPGGSGLLALQLLANEVVNPYPSGEPAPDGRERFERWHGQVLDALRRGEEAGIPWLSLDRPPPAAGARPEKLRRHVNTVCALAFSHRYLTGPGGVETCLLASSGADGVIHLWKFDAGHRYLACIGLRSRDEDPREPQARTVSRYPVPGIAFLNGGENLAWLAAASADGVRVFRIPLDGPTEPEEICFFGTSGLPQSLAAPREGELALLAVGCQDGRAIVWDPVRQRVVSELGRSFPARQKPARTDSYCCVAMSPKGDRVAVGCPEDRCVRVWELAGDPTRPDENGRVPWRLIAEFPPPADRRVDSLAFSPDGHLLAIGGGFRRGHIELWDLASQSCVVFPAHKDSVWALSFAPDPEDPNALILCSGSYDRSVAMWGLKSIERRAQHSGIGPRMLEGFAGRRHPVVDLPNPPMPLAHRCLPDAVFTAAVSPASTHFAVGGADCAVSLWDLKRLLEGRSESPQLPQPMALTLHAGALHPAGNRFASASACGEIRIASASPEQREIVINAGFDLPMRTVRFSGDGQLLAYGGDLGAGLYDLEARERLGNLAPGRPIHAVAFSCEPCNPRLALGDLAGGIYLIENLTRETARWPRVHQGCIRSLAFSPDGRWLASVGDDHKLILTDLAGSAGVLEIGGAEGHRGRVKSVAFSRCGTVIATGGLETIKLWRAAPGGAEWKLHATLRGHRDEIWSLAFSPGGRLLASGSHDCTARVWDVETGAQICSLPCWNNVLAVWLNAGEDELRVVEGGQTGSVPDFHVARIRGLARRPGPA